MAAKSGEDSLSFAVYLPPDVPMPFVDPLTATGPAVLSLFDNPDSYAGQTLPVIGEALEVDCADRAKLSRVGLLGQRKPANFRIRIWCANHHAL